MKNKPSDQLLEVAQEITFAKALASNDKTLRDKALRRLKKWIVSKSKNFTEDGLTRLWRGLFYNVWMSDKPLVQEEVVEGISNLVHCFNEYSDALAFITSFFQTLSDAWFGLDSHRFDKYLMFVRRFLRQSFMVAAKSDWDQKHVLELITVFEKAFLKTPLGLLLHISEVYLEELAKVSKGDLDKEALTEFIKPFGVIMSRSSDMRLIKHIGEYIYLYLLKQSDLGIKHQIKFDVWRKMGCPEGNINVIQEVELNSEEEGIEEFEENTSMDARAGHVDVILPHLKFDTQAIINSLIKLKTNIATSTRARKRLTDIINKYKTFERGKYPLGIHKVEVLQYDDEDEEVEDAALKLMEEEMEMYQKDKPLSKKKSKKLDESFNGKWVVTPVEPEPNEVQIMESPFNRSIDLHNNWQVSMSPSSAEAKSNPTSTDTLSANELTKKRNRKEQKRKKNTEQSTGSNESFYTCNSKNGEEKRKIKIGDSFNDWGNASWDEERETEISIEPKRKLRHSDVVPHIQLAKLSSQKNRKNSLPCAPCNRKKVEFVLNRNSIQDVEDYKRRLKKKPTIKFDGDLQPPLGVLKSSPFSSPVNPFILRVSDLH